MGELYAADEVRDAALAPEALTVPAPAELMDMGAEPEEPVEFEATEEGGLPETPEEPEDVEATDAAYGDGDATSESEPIEPAAPTDGDDPPSLRADGELEGAFLGDVWGKIRDTVFDRKAVDQSEDLYATVDRPAFDEKWVEGIGVGLVEYGEPLERPDGDRVPLFDGPPRRDQTEQGSLGDCGVIAALGAVAGHRPDDIANCVRENGDGTYEVTLHQVQSRSGDGWQHYEATGGKTVLTVTPDLPVPTFTPEEPAYASTGGGEMAWVAVMEKALAGVDQTWGDKNPDAAEGYRRLDFGSDPDNRAEILAQLTGLPAYSKNFPEDHDAQGRSPDRQLLDTLCEKLDNGFPVLIGTNPDDPKAEPLAKDLIPSHVYEVIAVDDRDEIHLRNPHNVDHPEPLTVEEFRSNVKNRYTTLG
ncbi:C2 family cysteine protease [Streptomyces sp. DSM 3412]|uniref:C2 family cysteine protease n=1 Tax=Streptomyces gottesmaniae TaxID=3075518 RepID=A0ABU2Z9S4_9ACTN|nr:C2 family cysteine protease [Streptomyces sp. DSM 3412]MDT0573121.1 C2 family cysteine protease [Streptomyces sp. DSM 3412]